MTSQHTTPPPPTQQPPPQLPTLTVSHPLPLPPQTTPPTSPSTPAYLLPPIDRVKLFITELDGSDGIGNTQPLRSSHIQVTQFELLRILDFENKNPCEQTAQETVQYMRVRERVSDIYINRSYRHSIYEINLGHHNIVFDLTGLKMRHW